MYTGKIGEWLGGFFVRDGGRGGGLGGVTVFLDESGDLNFGKRGSGWFVVGGVVTGDVRGVELVVRKVFRGFLKKGMRKRKGVMLHATKEIDATRRKVLRGLVGCADAGGVVLVVDKGLVREKMRGDMHRLYGDCVVSVIGAVVARYRDRRVRVVASRRETNKNLNVWFVEYVRERVLREYGIRVEVAITPAFRERGLQVADAVVWGVFRKWEFGDKRWCEMLGGKLREVFWE